MQKVNLRSQRRFAPDKMQKVPVFTSPHLFFDQYCLQPGQAQRVHTHEASSKIYVVLEGEATLLIDDEEERLTPLQAAYAPAGAPHGVRNDSADPVVLLVAMAPQPE